MKILALIGSYRKNGNTDRIVGMITTQLQKTAQQHNEPLEIETIYLGHQNIGPCRGCRACFDRGEEKCPMKDDFLAMKAKMRAADGILVASPVYVDDVSGITKTWIDRLAHVCHRPEFAGKSAFLVVTVGSSPCGHALQTLRLAMSTWGFHIAGMAGLKTGALMKPVAMQARYQKQAEKIALRFFAALHSRAFTRPSFMSLMTFRIQQLAWQKPSVDHDTIDYQYWKNQGWVEPGQVFYFPQQASPVKVALARLTGTLIARFVS